MKSLNNEFIRLNNTPALLLFRKTVNPVYNLGKLGPQFGTPGPQSCNYQNQNESHLPVAMTVDTCFGREPPL